MENNLNTTVNNNFKIATLKIASIQMISCSNDPQKNLDDAAKLVTAASNQGAELAVLPEFFIQMSSNNTDVASLAETLGCGKIQDQLSKIAYKNNIFLVAGTIPTKSPEANKYYNTCIVYNPSGEMVCHYNKIHLFKYADDTQNFDEGRTFTSGNDIVTFVAKNFNFGLSICYDLRFPELFRKMAGVDCIIMPAAFVYHTGKAHWEILLRARAIENQCYIIASDQGGIHDNGRHTFGHSMIIDPWGKVDNMLIEDEGVVMGIMEKDTINNVRQQLQALQHRHNI
ncbi:MAG: deaminated glutathione amidase [Pseudomonadota bacterium]|nr:deaminated glutathione amidase [Pseudomonadota bacterium]